MVLLVGIAAGLAAGLVRARLNRQNLTIPPLRWSWVIFIAFIPQYLAFSHPATSAQTPDNWAPFILVFSQALLLVWIFKNIKYRGIWLLGLGLFLNFIVIVLNGGLMPIRPEAVQQLVPNAPPGSWEIGARLGNGKDIVLLVDQTRLWFLSDWFLLPKWFNYPLAFSIGDVLIAAGAFWLLWSAGGQVAQKNKEQSNEQESL